MPVHVRAYALQRCLLCFPFHSTASAIPHEHTVQLTFPVAVAASAAAVPINTGSQVTPAGVIRIGSASSMLAAPAADVAVAVLDTGISSHTDLNVIASVNVVRPGGSTDDVYQHGTHCAGIIGARNNGQGVLGVAPGTALVNVKVGAGCRV